MSKVCDKIKELGLELPTAAKPVAAYTPAVKSGKMVYTAGQIPFVKGELKYKGKLGKDLTIEEGYEAAKICCLNALAAVALVVDDLDEITKVVKVNAFVNSADDFTDQPKVANGASELLQKIFGDAGVHARAAVGSNGLPLGAAVEVEIIVELK